MAGGAVILGQVQIYHGIIADDATVYHGIADNMIREYNTIEMPEENL